MDSEGNYIYGPLTVLQAIDVFWDIQSRRAQAYNTLKEGVRGIITATTNSPSPEQALIHQTAFQQLIERLTEEFQSLNYQALDLQGKFDGGYPFNQEEVFDILEEIKKQEKEKFHATIKMYSYKYYLESGLFKQHNHTCGNHHHDRDENSITDDRIDSEMNEQKLRMSIAEYLGVIESCTREINAWMGDLGEIQAAQDPED